MAAPATDTLATAETPEGGSGLSSTGSMSDEARDRWRRVQEAMGGIDALESVHGLVADARVSTPDGPGALRVRSFADGRLHFDQTISDGRSNRAEVVRGEDGDQLQTDEGLRPLEPLMSGFVRGHEFHMIAIAPALRYEGGELRPPEAFAGRSCDVVEFTDAFGKPLRMYIDAETDLPAGFVMIEPMSDDDAPITVTFSDWQDIDRLLLFTTLAVEHRGARFDYQYRDIQLLGPDEAAASGPAD